MLRCELRPVTRRNPRLCFRVQSRATCLLHLLPSDLIVTGLTRIVRERKPPSGPKPPRGTFQFHCCDFKRARCRHLTTQKASDCGHQQSGRGCSLHHQVGPIATNRPIRSPCIQQYSTSHLPPHRGSLASPGWSIRISGMQRTAAVLRASDQWCARQ